MSDYFKCLAIFNSGGALMAVRNSAAKGDIAATSRLLPPNRRRSFTADKNISRRQWVIPVFCGPMHIPDRPRLKELQEAAQLHAVSYSLSSRLTAP